MVCSFGDASVNHATAQAALNSAAALAYQGLPLPLLFVCEDNGLGISVRSPSGWVESALRARPTLRYEAASGDDPETLLEIAADLVDWIRARTAAGGAPPPRGALPQPRGRRCRGGLPDAGRDPRRLGRRPAARDRPLARPFRRGARCGVPRGARARLLDRACGRGATAARFGGRGDAAARAGIGARRPRCVRERGARNARAGDQRRARRGARARPAACSSSARTSR